jgi:hypothetical protein
MPWPSGRIKNSTPRTTPVFKKAHSLKEVPFLALTKTETMNKHPHTACEGAPQSTGISFWPDGLPRQGSGNTESPDIIQSPKRRRKSESCSVAPAVPTSAATTSLALLTEFARSAQFNSTANPLYVENREGSWADANAILSALLPRNDTPIDAGAAKSPSLRPGSQHNAEYMQDLILGAGALKEKLDMNSSSTPVNILQQLLQLRQPSVKFIVGSLESPTSPSASVQTSCEVQVAQNVAPSVSSTRRSPTFSPSSPSAPRSDTSSHFIPLLNLPRIHTSSIGGDSSLANAPALLSPLYHQDILDRHLATASGTNSGVIPLATDEELK